MTYIATNVEAVDAVFEQQHDRFLDLSEILFALQPEEPEEEWQAGTYVELCPHGWLGDECEPCAEEAAEIEGERIAAENGWRDDVGERQ